MLAGLGAATVGYLPWLLSAFPTLQSWPAISDPFSPADLALRLFRAFAYGVAWEQNLTLPAQMLPLALLALGLAAPLVRTAPTRVTERLLRTGVVVVALVVPPLLMWLVSLSRPSYNPKLLLAAVPFFATLVGAGAVTLASVVGRVAAPPPLAGLLRFAAVAAVAVAGGYFLARAHSAYLDDPRYARDDYRGLVRYLGATVAPGDGVILNAPGQLEIFDYYARGRFATYPLPRQRPADPGDLEAALAAVQQRHSGVWTVNWAVEQSDPGRLVDGWLARHGFPAASVWFGSVRVTPYALTVTPIRSSAPAARFDHGIVLSGVTLATRDGDPVSPLTPLAVSLEWRADRHVANDYTVFVQLQGPDGTVWAQHDGPPGAGSRPTSSWRAGETIVDRHAVAVPGGTPPGSYTLLIGLYDPANGSAAGAGGFARERPAGRHHRRGPRRGRGAPAPGW